MFIFECGCRSNDPRTKLGCVWDFSRIMIIQSAPQIFGSTCINLIRLRKGLQSVNVVIIFHDDRPASVSKRQETTAGSLRLSRDFPRILSCSCWPASRSSLPFTSKGWWSRWVTLPHQPACRAGALLVCHNPIGKSPWCCPRQAEFWRLGRTGWCATCEN